MILFFAIGYEYHVELSAEPRKIILIELILSSNIICKSCFLGSMVIFPAPSNKLKVLLARRLVGVIDINDVSTISCVSFFVGYTTYIKLIIF